MILSIQQTPEQTGYESQQDYFNSIRQDMIPPNQIITKFYEPDRNPFLKLVSVKERQQSLLNLEKKNSQTQSKFKYKVEFQDDDSLGYHYAEQIKRNLLYAKFDNHHFVYSPQNKCKYLAGFFIPLNSLLKPEVKLHKSIYKTLRQSQKITFTDYQDSVEESFKSNCFSPEIEIQFSSNYESSNLFMVFKTGNNEFDLVLQNDINSRGTTQWFNFAVKFTETGIYKFNIVNLTKSHSLFEKGMSIRYFSFQSNLIHNAGWMRGCQNISYEKSSITREGCTQSFYYNLHFEYQNLHKSDIVIFSYSYSYRGLDMERFFNKITQKKLSNSLIVEKTKICETLSGLPVYAYRIHPKKSILSLHNLHRSHLNILDNKLHKNDSLHPKGIVFLARQHPGQSQSSIILQGIIEFLLQNNEYENSKKNFHYYIFPMVNVDGVHYGNYRTNLSGNDLNRVWKQPRKDFHPEIYSIKKYLHNANRMTQLKLIIDLHGHSSALNSFFYGNPVKKQGSIQLLGQNPRLFPYYCSKQMKEISFLQSTFSVSEDKKGSARVVLNQMFPKASVYTLQNSFFGYKKGKKIVEYTVQKYKRLGRNLIASYFQYSKITQRIPLIKQKWEKQIQSIYSSLKSSHQNETSQDSDSQASQELIQYDSEYEEIDRLQNISQKENENDHYNKRSPFGQRLYNIHQRLYERKKQKYMSTVVQEDEKKHSLNGMYFQDGSNSLNTSMTAQLGFLSIVKIQTKNSPIIEKKQKSSNENSQPNENKYFQTDQCRLKQKEMTNLISKTQKKFKKQYTVRALKQQSGILKQAKDIKYINQRQFLMKRRRSLNKSSKINTSQLPNVDVALEANEKGKGFSMGSKSTNALNVRQFQKDSHFRSYYNI